MQYIYNVLSNIIKQPLNQLNFYCININNHNIINDNIINSILDVYKINIRPIENIYLYNNNYYIIKYGVNAIFKYNYIYEDFKTIYQNNIDNNIIKTNINYFKYRSQIFLLYETKHKTVKKYLNKNNKTKYIFFKYIQTKKKYINYRLLQKYISCNFIVIINKFYYKNYNIYNIKLIFKNNNYNYEFKLLNNNKYYYMYVFVYI